MCFSMGTTISPVLPSVAVYRFLVEVVVLGTFPIYFTVPIGVVLVQLTFGNYACETFWVWLLTHRRYNLVENSWIL